MTDHPTPERSEGPTPAGGAYAVALRDDQGRIVEIIEYDAEGNQLMRTYVRDEAPSTATPREEQA